MNFKKGDKPPRKKSKMSEYTQRKIHPDNILNREREINGLPKSEVFRTDVKRKDG